MELVWETQVPYQSTVEISAPFPPSGSQGSTAEPPEQQGSVVLQVSRGDTWTRNLARTKRCTVEALLFTTAAGKVKQCMYG